MGRYVKLSRIAVAITAAVFIYSIFIINMIISDRDFSESENRVLQKKPKITMGNILKGKFTTEFEDYTSDQFSFRDVWVSLKSGVDVMLGKRENNGVYLGHDGYLLQKLVKPTQDTVKGRLKALNSFAQKNPGINIYLALSPNSSQIEKDKLPYDAPNIDQKYYLDEIKNGLDKGIKYIDLYTPMENEKNEYIYYKTDHHWTTLGAYNAYKAIAGSMGYIPKDISFYKIVKYDNSFYGSLYSKGGFRGVEADSIEIYTPKEKEVVKVWYSDKKKETDTLYNLDNLEKKDKYTVFLDGNHPLVTIETENPGGDLLVIKDSYANCLVPFLTEHFSKIYMADLRYTTDSASEFIKKNNIKNVLILYNGNTFFEDSTVEHIVW